MLDPTCLGEKIRLYRRREGMTQTDLAEKIYVSFQAISSWECGSTLPDVENLCNLAKVFDVSVDELLEKQDTKGMCFTSTIQIETVIVAAK